MKPKEGLPTYCYACWKAKDVPFVVTVLPAGPRPPRDMTVRSKREVRKLGILKSMGGPKALSQRKRKARRRKT